MCLAQHIDNNRICEPYKSIYNSEWEMSLIGKVCATKDTIAKRKARSQISSSTFQLGLQDSLMQDITQKRLGYQLKCLSLWSVSKHEWCEHYDNLSSELQERSPANAEEVYSIRRALDEWEEQHLKALAQNMEVEKRGLETSVEEKVAQAALQDFNFFPLAKHWKTIAALDGV